MDSTRLRVKARADGYWCEGLVYSTGYPEGESRAEEERAFARV